jgi:hypothetical protein
MRPAALEADRVREEGHELPVAARAEVVVAGGGASGMCAAIAAARAGARTACIESGGFLGGVATGSLMAAFVSSSWATGIAAELIERLARRGAAPAWDPRDKGRTGTTPFDPECLKEEALDLMLDARATPLFHRLVVAPVMAGDRVRGVVVEGKSGRAAVLADVVVDCTGDADIAAAAGAPCTMGRESDHLTRPIALLFRLGGLDVRRIARYVEENPEEVQPQHRHGTHLRAGGENVISRISGFYRLVDRAKAAGELWPECHYFRLENLWVERGTAVCNTTRVYRVDGTSPDDLTRAEIEARRQIRLLVAFARRHVPGCENAFLIDVAPRLGVRETRRILARRTVTDEDAYGDAVFDDAVVTMDAKLVKRPVPPELDVHMPDPIEGSEKDLLERYPERVPRERHRYQIPYRALLPQGLDGLLVAGRAIGVSHLIDSSTRNMFMAMRLGQTAGVAAALAAGAGVSPAEVAVSRLREVLLSQGVSAGW